MTTSKPLISVIMPVYNGGSTIRQAVESVFCQNIPLELLVIDDGSTDQTSAVLSVYQDRPDFHYLKNQIYLPDYSYTYSYLIFLLLYHRFYRFYSVEFLTKEFSI